jgi:DNA-directed RNA polymerase specialized sigma subunit
MSLLKDPNNKKLLDEFMIEHAPLINKHINVLKSQNKIPPHVQEEDLHLAGFKGLMEAVHKFDPEIASRLSSKEGENVFAKYADKKIRGHMLDHVVSTGEIPKSHQKRAKNISLLPEASTEAETPTVNPIAGPMKNET